MITIEQLERFCVDALRHAGVGAEQSRVAAEALVLTDSWGVHTHGTKNLPGYIRRIRAGGIRRDGRPRIDQEGVAWALVDGDAALGMISSRFAMKRAIEKARQAGIAFAGLRNSCHFGAAGVYACQAADAGLIGIAMSNDTPTVAVPGSRGPVLGSNPFSFAIPFPGQPHIFLDIATSTVAGGKVFAAAARNEKIPLGWLLDETGKPATDPALFPARGALTPMAGHKGYGIALLIETLSAVLTGASVASAVLSWSFADAGLPTNHGAAFLAIDPRGMISRERFQRALEGLAEEIRTAPRADGVERIFLPGEIEWEKRAAALRDGLRLPREIVVALKNLAVECGLSFPSESCGPQGGVADSA